MKLMILLVFFIVTCPALEVSEIRDESTGILKSLTVHEGKIGYTGAIIVQIGSGGSLVVDPINISKEFYKDQEFKKSLGCFSRILLADDGRVIEEVGLSDNDFLYKMKYHYNNDFIQVQSVMVGGVEFTVDDNGFVKNTLPVSALYISETDDIHVFKVEISPNFLARNPGKIQAYLAYKNGILMGGNGHFTTSLDRYAGRLESLEAVRSATLQSTGVRLDELVKGEILNAIQLQKNK